MRNIKVIFIQLNKESLNYTKQMDFFLQAQINWDRIIHKL